MLLLSCRRQQVVITGICFTMHYNKLISQGCGHKMRGILEVVGNEEKHDLIFRSSLYFTFRGRSHRRLSKVLICEI